MGRIPSSSRHRRSVQTGPRRNDRIRVPEIRVIGPEGKMIGVMPTKDALDLAKSVGLDLVEVAPNSRPPVCRILDFGKYMYEQSKKQKESKSTSQKLKEVKFRVKIDTHDYLTKIRRAEDFLDKGNKLKLTLMFRGREMEHTDLGFETIKRAIDDLDTMAAADNDPRLAGRNISVTLSPLPSSRRKRRFSSEEVE
ncbi:MAG: translation initiation factor IF-3 [Verrucomicrobiota bacterium]